MSQSQELSEHSESDIVGDFALDTTPRSLSDVVSDSIATIKSGDLGLLPAFLAIAALVGLFGWANPSTFLSVLNMANLMEQASAIIVIAMAVSFTLLVGEIDLAAGFTAGVAAAVLATRLVDGWGLIPSVLLSAGVAIALGVFTGYMVARVGIPSFVVTLANFLIFQGILLLLVKEGGTVRIENELVSGVVGASLSPQWSWILVVAGTIVFGLFQIRRQRASHGAIPNSVVALRTFGVAAVAIVGTLLLNQNRALPRAPIEIRGIPIVIPLVLLIVFILTFILDNTRWGRHLYAVGGNPEAARRAGIDVGRIKLAAFAICGLLAGIGGAFLASNVNSVSATTGGSQTLLLAVGAAVIGGTSLFGGKGRMINGLVGGLVLALIPNGLPLVGKRALPLFNFEIDFSSSGVKFIAFGSALMLAASVDALSRKRTS